MIAELKFTTTTWAIPNGTAGVMELLRQQAKLYSKLEGFSRRQRMLVSDEDTRPLLALLAERQKLSLELAIVSRRLGPVRENWSTYRELMTAGERSEAAELLDTMQGHLSRVIENDEQDARALSVRKQMVRSIMAESQVKGAAAGAYRAASASSGRRLDEEL